MTANSDMFKRDGLYGVFAIVNSSTGIPVDVMAGMTSAIWLARKWGAANPGAEFGYRPATQTEEDNAHLIQADALLEFIDPIV